jgi:tripartite-type tricarboxylate transporter receptor subunit TctC
VAFRSKPLQNVQEGVMTIHRRAFLRLAAGAAVLPAVSRVARARTYPSQRVRLVEGPELGFPGAGAASAVCKSLSERFGQTFNLLDSQSPSKTAATERVVKARPDGHTLLLLSEANAIIAALDGNIAFDLARDIAPVAGLIRMPLVMMVSPSFPATVPEFIAYAKANPSKMNYASADDTLLDLAAELLKMMTGIDMVRVPHANLVELRGGLVPVRFGYLPRSLELIRDGWGRALAVTTTTRAAALPDVPTLAEYIPGYEASAWQGVGAPKGTPADIVETLNLAINAALADPKTFAPVGNAQSDFMLAALSRMPLSLTPADFGKLIAQDIEKWGKLIKFAGIKPGPRRPDIP